MVASRRFRNRFEFYATYDSKFTSMSRKPIKVTADCSVPAKPGCYRILPPPDLNLVSEDRYLLEYDWPLLTVRDMATRPATCTEMVEAIGQAGQWRNSNPGVGEHIGYHGGYQLIQPTSRLHLQLVPDISYVDQGTCSRLSPEDKKKAYLPCVPAVVIEVASETDDVGKLKEKVEKFMNAGTKEGVIVDTWHQEIWLFNNNDRPVRNSLCTIVFDYWPGFEFDCSALRNARINEG